LERGREGGRRGGGGKKIDESGISFCGAFEEFLFIPFGGKRERGKKGRERGE